MSTPPLMIYDPATNCDNPYPSEANQYREYHPNKAWLYNPYTGESRKAEDVADDLFGKKLPSIESDSGVLNEELGIAEYNGKIFQAVANSDCLGCYFYTTTEARCHFKSFFNRPEKMQCTAGQRDDSTSIIWIKQEG